MAPPFGHVHRAGASFIALSMYGLTAVYGDVGFWYLAQSRMLLGIGCL